jgi:Protein of unknown function (DUF2723)
MVRALGRAWPSVLVALVALVATRLAMLPGLGFWDTAELQTVAPVLGTAHPTGFPTYVISGWIMNALLAPFGEPAFRMNLYAGVCVAIAAAVMADLVRTVTRSAVLAIAAGIGFALTDLVWSIGTRADAHALHIALVAILIRLLVAWEDGRRDGVLVSAAVVCGLAIGNHSLTLLLGLPIALYVLAVEPRIWRRPRLVAACAGALGATVVAVFAELPLRAGPLPAPLVYGRPDTWEGFWYIVLATQFVGSFVAPFGDLPAKLGDLVTRTASAFGPLAVLIPVGWLATAIMRPNVALLTGLGALLTCFFAASYVNAEIGRYYLGPILFGWVWLAILGAAVVTSLSGVARPEDGAEGDADAVDDEGDAQDASHGVAEPIDLGPPRWAVATTIAVALMVPTILAVPARYGSVDRSGDTLARAWVDDTLEALAPDAVVVSWWSYSTPLWYAQHVEGRRTDIAIIDDRTRLDLDLGDLTDVIDANLPTRPVYVIRSDPREVALIAARYVLDPVDIPHAGGLARVVGLRGGGS